MEAYVLGAIMDESSLGEVLRIGLTPETFYSEVHATMFRAILDLYGEGRPIDVITVADRASRLGMADAYYECSRCIEKVGSGAHLFYHALLLQQKYIARRLFAMGEDLSEKSSSAVNDVYEVLQWAGQTLADLTANIQEGVLEYRELLRDTVRDIQATEEKARQSDDGSSGISTGIHKYDELMGGLRGGELGILAARPAMGKTTVALQMATNIALRNIPTAFFTIEMKPVNLCKKVIASTEQVGYSSLITGRLTEDDWRKIDNHAVRTDKMPLYIIDAPGITVNDLASQTKTYVDKYGIKAVFIDYLQLMNSPATVNFQNREQQVAYMSRRLKMLARELDIPVVALCQLNRAITSRADKVPEMSDLRDSGAIEQDADWITFVHRPEYYKITEFADGTSTAGSVCLISAKNRNGVTGEAVAHFRGDISRVEDW